MITLLSWVLIFVLMVVLDFIWALYNQATVSKKPWTSSGLAVVIYLVGAFGVLSYTSDMWLLIPGSAGAFVGTFLATRRK